MQTKQDIITELEHVFNEITSFAESIDDATFKKRVDKKWSIAENMDHLSISNTITAVAFTTAKFILIQTFKTNKRNNLNYDEVVWRYQRSLSDGGKASFPYQPKLSLLTIRFITEIVWKNSISNLMNAINNFNEEDLDTYLIPHPLIGKITPRELLFFTIYHVNHHLKTIKSITEK